MQATKRAGEMEKEIKNERERYRERERERELDLFVAATRQALVGPVYV